MIPAYVNNFNRLSSCKALCQFLQKESEIDIVILDNASTYPPLLEWYKNCPFKVHFLGKNMGHLAPWVAGVVNNYKCDYIVSDSDVVPYNTCPNDWLGVMKAGLEQYQTIAKCGFSIEIDDIPCFCADRIEVLAHQTNFFVNKVGNLFYRAPIDTTFALYSKKRNDDISHVKQSQRPALRTQRPYIAQHMPWYIDPAALDEEEHFYISHANTSSTTSRRILRHIRRHCL